MVDNNNSNINSDSSGVCNGDGWAYSFWIYGADDPDTLYDILLENGYIKEELDGSNMVIIAYPESIRGRYICKIEKEGDIEHYRRLFIEKIANK